MSSRNSYLNENEKNAAAAISKILKESITDFKNKNASQIIKKVSAALSALPQSKTDYVQMRNYDNLSVLKSNAKKAVLAVAVWMGKTRLIDNIMLTK
jgi:pantoate--beta-alanine ligase